MRRRVIRRKSLVEKKDGKSFKALFIKDPHFRFGMKFPSGRKETYFEEIEVKVDDLIRIGRERNIKILCIAGDVFDIKQPSLWSGKAVTKNHRILQKLKEQFTVYTIAGNHDLIGSARSNKPESMYSHFVESGLIVDIHDKPQKIGDVYLYGIDFNSDITMLKREIKAIDTKAKKIKADNPQAKIILMFHEHLYPNNLKDDNEKKFIGSSFNYRYLVNNYKNIDVFNAGHLHRGFPTEKYRGKVIINNWGFTRLARSHYTLDGSHIPTAVELTIGNDITFEDIPLKTADFNSSIDVDVMLQELRQEIDISNFLNTIEDVSIEDDEDYFDLASLPDEVKNKIEYFLEMVKN